MKQLKKKKNNFSGQKQQAGAELKKKKKSDFLGQKNKMFKKWAEMDKNGLKKKQNRPKWSLNPKEIPKNFEKEAENVLKYVKNCKN